MSERDELTDLIRENRTRWATNTEHHEMEVKQADAILAAGYRKPREIMTPAALESLPFGSALQTSDEEDTVVLKGEGVTFRNQSGAELSATDLWRYGTHPMIVLYEPAA